MKFRHTLLTLVIVVLSLNASWAQNKTIPNVVSIELRNMGPIFTESEVSGYYMFYQTDKLSKKTLSYEIEILDQNLNKLSSTTFEGSKYLTLVDVVYNTDALMLKMFDAKTKKITLTQFNNNAEETSKSVRVAKDYEIMVINQSKKREGVSATIFPINNVGFVDYRSEKNKKYGYVIDFYSSQEEGKRWRVSSSKKSSTHEFVTHIYGDENIVISAIYKKKSLMGRKIDMSILAINAVTGKKMYEKVITDPDYELLVMSGLESDADGNIYLFGNYYPKGKSELTNPSIGLFSMKLDVKGNTIDKNFISWSEDVSKFVDVNEKGKFKDFGYVFIHDIVRNTDGTIYAIGEQYKKQIKGLVTTLVIEDMVIFELSSDYKLLNVNIVDKEKSTVVLPGMGMLGSHLLAYFVKSGGGFDFKFVEFNKDQSIFSIAYVDYLKLKGETNKISFGSITYVDGQPTKDSFELMTVKEDKEIKVLPAKIGNIVVVEYREKEKALDLKLMKINY